MLIAKSESIKTNTFKLGICLVLPCLLLLLLMINACSPERKMVKRFLADENPRHALLIAPQFIYKTNLKEETFDSLKIKDERLFDSVLLANTVFINKIQDSLFIANYMLGMDMELKRFGFKVYREDATTSFMEIDSNAYFINLAQVEIEESYYTTREEVLIYNSEYYHDHQLNAAFISSWIEVNEINANTSNHNVYFSTDVITDYLDGEFVLDYLSNQVKYLYEIDTLKPADIYNFAFTLGRTYAGYTFDLLMNTYLKENLPEEKLSGKYWRYNPELDNLFYAVDDKFVPLEN